MQRNKYLDDLGIPINKYGTNFTKGDFHKRKRWTKQRKLYGFDDRETWNLDYTFIEWLYSRLMMYKEVSIVDLNFNKYEFEGKEISQGEAIDYILNICKEVLKNDKYIKHNENLNKAIKLFADILHDMWW